ncbi:hypothetical protein SCLCIDRAFT_631598 [Scleroderma citrinum Foug A]|uniref:Uncharacterized protein n=1 Tax=Scleroderma citrinum Foug A TaxID=1036808 RepID=A0A0C2ZSD3_9AGAM|nr:hypothetical protein SCLCIDRAFT_631598 [Scleroderma citrinum Foug A]
MYAISSSALIPVIPSTLRRVRASELDQVVNQQNCNLLSCSSLAFIRGHVLTVLCTTPTGSSFAHKWRSW